MSERRRRDVQGALIAGRLVGSSSPDAPGLCRQFGRVSGETLAGENAEATWSSRATHCSAERKLAGADGDLPGKTRKLRGVLTPTGLVADEATLPGWSEIDPGGQANWDLNTEGIGAQVAPDAQDEWTYADVEPVPSLTNQPDASLYIGEDDALQLDVVSFDGEEELNRLFEFRIDVAIEASMADMLDERRFAGQRAALVMRVGPRRARTIRGLISGCEYVGLGHSHVYFRFTLSPPIWLMTRRRNSRIFQDQTTPQIIGRMLVQYGLRRRDFQFALKESYAPRNYCVQYGETDWDFIARLMEEEGLYCFYRERKGRFQLQITDGRHGHPTVTRGAQAVYRDPEGMTPAAGTVYRLRARRQERAGKVSLVDYAATKPSMPLDAVGTADARGVEVFGYPGEYRDRGLGQRIARVRAEELHTERDRATARSTRMDFAPGGTFELAEHKVSRMNKGLLITRVRHTCRNLMQVEQSFVGGNGASDSERPAPSYTNEFDAMPREQPYRPDRRTPRPRVAGPQTAVVTGPPGEEIHTDEHGRVKVQFRWDREGVHDDNSSCWIRVSQPWAGPDFGGLAIPRVGQEVIVDFLEGDPDQPIITGRVYNGEAMAPQSLPRHKARTSIRSNSYPGGGGFNEMTMDDTAGAEHFYMKAQYDKTEEVGNNRSTSVGVDSTEVVGNNVSESVGNNMSTDVTNAYDVTCDTMLINAKTSITLQCGASRIHMNQAGFISITGTVITSAATVNNSMMAPMTEVVGSVMLTQAGAVVLIEGGATHVRGEILAALKGGKVDVIAGAENVIQGSPVKIN